MKAALYARVSTVDKDQNPEVQLSNLREYCQSMGWEIYQEYVDKASAADIIGRKSWSALMKDAALHKFDVLLVWKIDRAFRSVLHASTSLKMLMAYQVGFKSLTESFIDTTTPFGEAIFYISVAFAGLEREQISQRSKAGINHAKRYGTKSGRAIGRPALNIPVKNVSDALRVSDTVTSAAQLLAESFGRCSKGYIYQVMGRAGLNPKDLLKTRASKKVDVSSRLNKEGN